MVVKKNKDRKRRIPMVTTVGVIPGQDRSKARFLCGEKLKIRMPEKQDTVHGAKRAPYCTFQRRNTYCTIKRGLATTKVYMQNYTGQIPYTVTKQTHYFSQVSYVSYR